MNNSDNAIIKEALKTLPERRQVKYRWNAEFRAIYSVLAKQAREETGETGYWYYWYPNKKDVKRLRKRLAKKARRPFRRKKRGPLRARAAGKNNYRPRSR